MSIDIVNEQPSSPSSPSVSWASILVGATVAAAMTVSLVVLATGLGLILISPWSHQSASIKTFAISSAIAMVVIQWISAALGGYIAGRLRPDWADAHADEQFFRDTAHGFAVWCVGTIVVASLAFGSAITAGKAAADAGKALTDNAGEIQQYASDQLFRGAGSITPERRVEALRIIAVGAANGEFSADDRDYLAQLASAAGVSQGQVKNRVDQVIATLDRAKQKAQQVADETRKAASRGALFAFLSMVIGAFIASAAAALGGSLRDRPSA